MSISLAQSRLPLIPLPYPLILLPSARLTFPIPMSTWVQFGSIQFIWSILVLFGPFGLIWYISVQFGLLRSYSVRSSTLILLGPFGLLWSYSVHHFHPIWSNLVRSIHFGSLPSNSNSILLGEIGSFAPIWSNGIWVESTYSKSKFIKKNIYIYRFQTHNDDAENITSKSHGPWALLMTPAQREERILAECIGVVPAKYPPKIKSELFSLL